MAGLFENISETPTGKKKTPRKPVPVSSSPATLPPQQALQPTPLPPQQALQPTPQETEKMSKASSYFSVQEHTFLVKGRKENKGTEIEVKDYALYFENELMEIPFQPMPTVPERMKHVKLAGMKEMVSILEKGYPEETTSILLKEGGYKELVKTLKDNKVLCLNFLSFIKEEIEKIPSKPRGRQAGSSLRTPKATTDALIRDLVGILAGLEPHSEPDILAGKLLSLVNDENRMARAVEILEEKLESNKRDSKGYILLRHRKKGGKIKPKK